jgi:toxin CcdB
MGQWDVYVNPSPRARAELPYLVDVQSDLLAALTTRLVVPFAAADAAGDRLPRRMCPIFEIDGRKMVLVPQEAGPVPALSLRQSVASLRGESLRVIDAIDTVISGV